MEELQFKQHFTIRGIPVFMATENSFRGVFLAKEIIDLFYAHFAEMLIPNRLEDFDKSNHFNVPKRDEYHF